MASEIDHISMIVPSEMPRGVISGWQKKCILAPPVTKQFGILNRLIALAERTVPIRVCINARLSNFRKMCTKRKLSMEIRQSTIGSFRVVCVPWLLGRAIGGPRRGYSGGAQGDG